MISPAPADFCFKQFSIWHQQCAMKVNTDGILLGAWANVQHAKNILDIGTGTGLIALMLAQRTQSNSAKTNITALEIDSDAYQQALYNVKKSPWPSQFNLVHHDFLTWKNNHNIEQQHFDLIVSNPPYFEHSLLSDCHHKNLARHTKHMTFEQLISSANELLADDGQLNLILPLEQGIKVVEIAALFGITLIRQTGVRATPNKGVSRLLLGFKKTQQAITPITNELIIRNSNNQYSQEYVALCKDFYLKM